MIPTARLTRTAPPPARSRLRPLALWLAAWSIAGCRSPQAHVATADEAVYAILEDRRVQLEADLGDVRVEPRPGSLRERLLTAGPQSEPVELDLLRALEVAAENSREYQRRKEQLYLSALDLTLERWRFQVQQKGTLGALLAGSGDEAQQLDLDAGFSLTRLLGTGALVVGDIGISMFRNLTTGDSFDPVTDISLSITQPLLRGFGRRIVLEPLTQAERDVVYEVRSFERYRRTFAVDVYARYLRLVQLADTVRNERNNIENLNELRERNEALAEAGRLSDIQVDQARNQEIGSRDALLQLEQNYAAQLDDFKLVLGLPPQTRIEIVADALERLAAVEPAGLRVDDPEALSERALQWRLDHMTALDQVDDARRRVDVAADALRSVLDFRAGASASSEPGKPANIDLDDVNWTVGLDLDLGLERLPERNAYRSALISLQASRRAADESADSVRVDVRDALREAERTLQTWRLQQNQVQLNERRVESARLNLEAGRADTRDILEAQEALLDAQNAATRALIDQRLAVLTLWLDLEILRLDESGPHPDPELLALLETPVP